MSRCGSLTVIQAWVREHMRATLGRQESPAMESRMPGMSARRDKHRCAQQAKLGPFSGDLFKSLLRPLLL